MVTGHRAALLLMFNDGNSGLKMPLAQDMLFAIVSHDAGDLTGMASRALLAIDHNKTIHGFLLFGCKTLFFIRVLLTDTEGSGNVHCREAQLFMQNLWQINLFHRI